MADPGQWLAFRDERETVCMRPLLESVDSRLLRPEFMSDLRKWLVIQIRDVIETAINRRYLLFCQVQVDPLLPKLIERKIIT